MSPPLKGPSSGGPGDGCGCGTLIVCIVMFMMIGGSRNLFSSLFGLIGVNI